MERHSVACSRGLRAFPLRTRDAPLPVPGGKSPVVAYLRHSMTVVLPQLHERGEGAVGFGGGGWERRRNGGFTRWRR